jgi:hypothetical protein
MKFYSIGKFAKIIGKSAQTLRNSAKSDTMNQEENRKSLFVDFYKFFVTEIDPKNRIVI